MDKFLNFSFKFGKVLFSILLVIALFVCLCLFVKATTKAIEVGNTKVKYDYNVEEIVNKEAAEFEQETINEAKPQKIEKGARVEEKIKNFAKEKKLSEDLTNDLIRVVNTIAEEDKLDFFNHFIIYFDSYTDEVVKLGINKYGNSEENIRNSMNSNINNITAEIFNGFADLYEKEKNSVIEQKNSLEQERNTSFIAFLISLGIFILFLFLPILIRIEENTRK